MCCVSFWVAPLIHNVDGHQTAEIEEAIENAGDVLIALAGVLRLAQVDLHHNIGIPFITGDGDLEHPVQFAALERHSKRTSG
tara:strand:- start:309 stop:554 length:246 start_codon:yes stop_codon:yes gene_type:complete